MVQNQFILQPKYILETAIEHALSHGYKTGMVSNEKTQKEIEDTSQHQAAFFHKFGLVRLSLNPGVLTPGFFIY